MPENLPGKTDEVKDTIKNIPETTSKEAAAKNGQDAVEIKNTSEETMLQKALDEEYTDK